MARPIEWRSPVFGWLPQHCPRHGTKLRWRDRAKEGSVLMRAVGSLLLKLEVVGVARARGVWKPVRKGEWR